ncbi:MAG: Cytochrome c [Chloroflexi bacterium]|jgi:mono/diheme cytochrome c family protein|nr:Cytochrome c [Chloroflexota bacterium]
MGGRAHWLRPALGAAFLGLAAALSGCGSSALPGPPPASVATSVAALTQQPAATTTKATPAAPGVATPAVSAAQLAAGKAAFLSAGCGGCHMLTAAGTTGGAGPSLNGIGKVHDAAWIVVQIKNPCASGHANAAGPNYNCLAMPAGLASGASAQAIAVFLAAQK